MKQVLSVLALAAASCLAVPALAQSASPGSGAGGSSSTGSTGFFTANASGALEVPPNASPGVSTIKLDVGGTSMSVDMPFSNLLSTSTEGHIHCCTTSAFSGTAPVAVPFTGFPTGVTSGTYIHTFALGSATTYDPLFLKTNGGSVSGASAALLNAIAADEAYVNIHTTEFPSGEIRGWLVAAPVPEPAEWAMLGIGVGGLLLIGRRRRIEFQDRA